jgi:hypothetical protein
VKSNVYGPGKLILWTVEYMFCAGKLSSERNSKLILYANVVLFSLYVSLVFPDKASLCIP